MTGASIRKVAAAAVFALLAFSVPPEVSAQRAGPAESVDIVVNLIEASDGLPGVDPEIRPIIRQLEGAFRYSTYRLVSRIRKKIRIGDRGKIPLPGLRELHVYPRGHEGRRIKLKIKIIEKSMRRPAREVLSTDFRIVEGGTIIIGGYNYHNGKLIVAISAKR